MKSATRSRFFLPFLLSFFVATACTPRTVLIAPAAPDPAWDSTFEWSDWALTLSRAVCDRCINYQRLRDDPAPLDRTLARVAIAGPVTRPAIFPSDADQLAYLINCYNASMLRSIVALAGNRELPSRIPFDVERRYQFTIDGRVRTPSDLRREIATRAGDDWRVRLALHTGRRGDPALPPRPFLGDMFAAQIAETTRNALEQPQIVNLDHEWKRLRLWDELFELRKPLLEEYQRQTKSADGTILNVLLTYCRPEYRPILNTAVGYAVDELPRDDHLDAAQPQPAPLN